MNDPYFHKQLLAAIASQDRRVANFYARQIIRISRLLQRHQLLNKNRPWMGNEMVRRDLKALYRSIEQEMSQMLQEGIKASQGMANRHQDAKARAYLKGKPVTKEDVPDAFYRDKRTLGAYLASRAKGLRASIRVWRKGTEKLIENYIKEGLAEGRSAAKISQDLKKYLRHPDKRFRRVRDPRTGKLKLSKPAQAFHPGRGVYRSAYKNAMRMARTEVNAAYRYADHLRVKQMPFVKGIRVNLSAAHPKYDICDELQGEYPKDFVFQGWHPHCICFTTTILAEEKEFIDNLNHGTPIRGQRDRIPKRASRYIKKHGQKMDNYKSRPWWIEDNFKVDRKGDWILQNGGGQIIKTDPLD